MIGTGQRSCQTRQNASTNAQSKEVENTHQVDLEGSQTSQASKRLYQATSTASRNVLGKLATSAAMKRMHQVEIEPLEAIEASRRRQEPSRAIRTAQTLSTTPDMMADTPGAMETSVLHQVRGPGGHLDEQAESKYVEGNLERQSDGDGDRIGGRRC